MSRAERGTPGARGRARLPVVGSLVVGALCAVLPAFAPSGILAMPRVTSNQSSPPRRSAGITQPPVSGPRISGGGTVAQRFLNGAYVRFTMGGVAEGGTSARGVLAALVSVEDGGKRMASEGMLSIRCIATRVVGTATQVFMVGTARSFDPQGPNGDAYVYLVDDPKGDRLWSGQMDRMPSTCTVPDEVFTFGTMQRLDQLAQVVTDGDFVVRR